jgi:hypothetical protein
LLKTPHTEADLNKGAIVEKNVSNEIERKEKLFDALNRYFEDNDEKLSQIFFEEVYDGLATVSDLSKNHIGFELENGKKLKQIPITPQISELSACDDLMYVLLGRNRGKWWLLDVMSIGSLMNANMSEAHLTFNPQYMGSFSELTEINEADFQ